MEKTPARIFIRTSGRSIKPVCRADGGSEEREIMAWDPNVYLAFGAERTRPAADLLARVALSAPSRVADLGCGPGNSTALLRARWPGAVIEGIDSSPEMLRDARERGVDARFVEADLARWTPDAPFDVLYSNAALQWLKDHETLFPRLLSFLAPGGVLAVQVPRNFDEPCHRLIRQAVADPRWAERLKGVRDWWNVGTAAFYYDLLAASARAVDLWETRYTHILTGADPIFHWMTGSGLRPFAAALEPPLREEFLAHYRDLVAQAYRPRADGKTLYPFQRLFMVASV
jgi:trans-aconitate 2-methyltransferase